MRFYRSDGTIRRETNDSEFGWRCSEFVIDENVPLYEVTNHCVRKGSVRNDIDENLEDSINLNEEKITITVYKSNVFEHAAETSDQNIQDDTRAEDNCPKEFINIDSVVPSKQQLSDLVDPISFESRMLLSVIHYAKFEKLQDESLTFSSPLKKSSPCDYEQKKSKAVRYLLKDNQKEYSKLVKKVSGRNGYACSESNLLSLMVELTLTDTPYRMEEVLINKDVFETRRKLLNNGVNDNIVVHCGTTTRRHACGTRCCFKANSRNAKDYVTLDHFSKTTCEMHAEISEIKKGFQVRFRHPFSKIDLNLFPSI